MARVKDDPVRFISSKRRRPAPSVSEAHLLEMARAVALDQLVLTQAVDRAGYWLDLYTGLRPLSVRRQPTRHRGEAPGRADRAPQT